MNGSPNSKNIGIGLMNDSESCFVGKTSQINLSNITDVVSPTTRPEIRFVSSQDSVKNITKHEY
jgi:hypothetical protein